MIGSGALVIQFIRLKGSDEEEDGIPGSPSTAQCPPPFFTLSFIGRDLNSGLALGALLTPLRSTKSTDILIVPILRIRSGSVSHALVSS